MSSSSFATPHGNDYDKENLDGLSSFILEYVVSPLDDKWNAKQWNLNIVAIMTAIVILIIKKLYGKRHGVDWYGFVHAIVTGLGSVMCLYLDYYAAHILLDELSNPGQCSDKPLTTLHKVLPAITMGYSIFDFVDSCLELSVEFVLHGGATFAVMALFVWHDVPHLVNSMLLMEVSSIFLNFIRYEKFPSPIWNWMVQCCFAITFLLFRIILVPYIWIVQVTKLLKQEQTNDYCLPYYFSKLILLLGPFFHFLNAYWFYKIIRKIIRKVSGKEKLTERNDLMESEADENEQHKSTTTTTTTTKTLRKSSTAKAKQRMNGIKTA